MRPRLLVLSSTYPRWENDSEPGFVHELCKRMAQRFEVHVLSPHAPGAKTKQQLNSITVHRFRYAPSRWETLVQGGGILANLKRKPWQWLLLPMFFAAMIWQTCSLIRRLHPGIVHAHWIIPQGLAIRAIQLLGIQLPPVVITSHGSDLFSLRSKFFAGLKRQIIMHTTAVAVVSRAMQNELNRLGARPARLHVLPMGIDFSRFTPGVPESHSRCELLFVGRLIKQKGLVHLLDALPEVLRHQPAAHLLVAGDGPERTALQLHAQQLGLENQVHFLGALSQDELPPLYRRAALTVIPFTGREGLGLVTLEAIACGCPVVVSALEAVEDLLDTHIDAQNLVPPSDAGMLAKRITQVLPELELYRQHALEQRDRLIKQYDWSIVAQRYADLFEELESPRTHSEQCHS